MGGGPLIEQDEEDSFTYQAVVSYMMPIKAAVGIKAKNRKEAEGIVNSHYSGFLNYELHSLDIAPHDTTRQLIEGIIH